MHRSVVRNFTALALGTASALALSVPVSAAHAQASDRSFNIPAQDLATALEEFSRQSGKDIIFDRNALAGRRSLRVSGSYEPQVALRLLVSASGATVRAVNEGTFVVSLRGQAERRNTQANNSDAAMGSAVALQSSDQDPIVVTGSRIRGAEAVSPVITLTAEAMREAGFGSMQEVIATLPQNFNGGQNPQVIGGDTVVNQNSTSASSINLRGLGPDATLTLLNGRRMSYDGIVQAVDISVIPLVAVDRLEILTDGASAIYGSDAVAGVANVILRRDYEGLGVSGRLGVTSEGDGFQQRYGAVAGTSSATAGFILSYDYQRTGRVDARRRESLSYLSSPYVIVPEIEQHNVLGSGHYSITDRLEISVDALYAARDSVRAASNGFAVQETTTQSEFVSVSPRLALEVHDTWMLSLTGILSRNSGVFRSVFSSGDTILGQTERCYCNNGTGLEFGAEGPLVSLPAGSVRTAVGVGYRRNESASDLFEAYQRSLFAFGEIYVPLVAGHMGIPSMNRAALTASLRHERYNRFGSVTTPRLGLVLEPFSGLELKSTWGRSFKVPTLLQQNFYHSAYVDDAAYYSGGVDYPDNAVVLVLGGGNRDLRPERAATWTTTASIQPSFEKRLRLDITYFNISYRERVIEPVDPYSALNNPQYAQYVTYSPSEALQQAVIGSAAEFNNYSTNPYDPAGVVAFIDVRPINASRQRIEGLDASLSFDLDLGASRLQLFANGSWLRIRQRDSAASPEFSLAGTVLNPANFRARGGASWRLGGAILSAFINHVGELDDDRSGRPFVRIDSMTTVDAAGTYRFGPEVGGGSRVEFSVAVQNLFNARPPLLTPGFPGQVNYDATNHSAVGRTLSAALSIQF